MLQRSTERLDIDLLILEQRRLSEVLIMSALLGVVAAVYGGSLVIVAGGGLLWLVSGRFRRVLVGDRPRV